MVKRIPDWSASLPGHTGAIRPVLPLQSIGLFLIAACRYSGEGRDKSHHHRLCI